MVGPGLYSEIGLGVESDAEDDDGEKAGQVARELPVLPLPRLPGRRRDAVEEVAIRPVLVARGGPAARAVVVAAAGADGGGQAGAEHTGGCREGFRRRHLVWLETCAATGEGRERERIEWCDAFVYMFVWI